jgi:Tfp pilus assembly protein PilF
MGDSMTAWPKRAALYLIFLMLCSACVQWPVNKSFTERQDMEKYAQERYLRAVEYMKVGKYELAQQQFSVASASAVSPGLKQLATNGYDKAGLIIEEQR